MKFVILIFNIFFCVIIYAQVQDVTSRTTAFIDSLNNAETWGENTSYIDNLEKLSIISSEEDSFRVYELCRTSIHITYHEMDDYIGLSNALSVSINFAKDTLNSSPYYRSSMLGAEALLHRLSGGVKEASDLRLMALDIVKDLDGTIPKITTIYANLVVDYMLLGDFVKSKEYSIKGLEMLELNTSDIYHNAFFNQMLGKVDYKEFNFSSSINYLNKARRIIEEKYYDSFSMRRLRIDNLLWLAECYISLGEVEKSKVILDEVWLWQSKNSYREYRYFEIKAQYYSELGDREKVLQSIKESLISAKNKQLLNTEFSVIPRLYFKLAEFYFREDSLEPCLLSLQNGLSYFADSLNLDINYCPPITDIQDTEIALKLLILKTELCSKLYSGTENESNYFSAVKAYKKTLEMLSAMRKSFLLDGSKFYVLEKALPVYDDFLDLVYQHWLKTGDDADKDLIYDIIGETKSAVLSDNIDYKSRVEKLDISPDLIQGEKDLRLKRALYAKLVKKTEQSDSFDIEVLSALKDSLFDANQDYAILDNKIRAAKSEQDEVRIDYNLDVKEFMTSLNAGEMAIDFYESSNYMYSISLFDGELVVDRVGTTLVDSTVAEFISMVSNPPTSNDDQKLLDLSEVLYDGLLKSYADRKDLVKELRILPSGILNSLPFEALSYKESDRIKYLVEDCPVLYSLSRSQLLKKTKLQDEINVLAVAPKFGSSNDFNCDGVELYNLKYAQEEVKYINTTFKRKSEINHLDNSSYFLENVVDYKICHLATHGCVNPNDPLLSKVFFSDGSINSYDILNLDTDISLMVLSACNSASGDNVKGEGVISLTRGFFEAGVNNTISSLWAIDDLSSSQVIKGLYDNIEDGNNYSQALRLSKLEYLEDADKLRAHPYYWAGLVQIGAGVNAVPSNNWILYILGGLLIFIALSFLKTRKISLQQ